MKHLRLIFAALALAACDPPMLASDPNLDVEGQIAPASLLFYEASEWEPSWNLKLSNGNLIEFTQLDPATGSNMVTSNFNVSNQTALSNGWAVQSGGATGSLLFITLDVSANGGCTHSGSGIIHRDKVMVASPTQVWRGCGGPEL